MTKQQRIDCIEDLDEYKAWANHKREDLISPHHTSQELLDIFRIRIMCKLASVIDDELPETHSDRWKFIYDEWDHFAASVNDGNYKNVSWRST